MKISRLVLLPLLVLFSLSILSACSEDPVYAPCPVCAGTTVCVVCEGKESWCEYCRNTGDCSKCRGTGWDISKKWCPECGVELKFHDTECTGCGIKVKHHRVE